MLQYLTNLKLLKHVNQEGEERAKEKNRKKMPLSSLFLFVLFPEESKVINKLLKRMWAGGRGSYFKVGNGKRTSKFSLFRYS